MNRFDANGSTASAAGLDRFIIGGHDRILVTGAAGFIGCRVVDNLLGRGLRNLVCLVRHSSDVTDLQAIIRTRSAGASVEIVKGNLLSPADCETATRGVALTLHLAAGIGEKSYPDAYMNSVVATRNLMEAVLRNGGVQRLVLVSSFTVYTNRQRSHKLDETCPTEERPQTRGDAYCYAKVEQENMVVQYGQRHGVSYVIVRPGSVYGPGNSEITGRVGIGTFGLFLHLGGSNRIPFTYVDNCADAIVLAGLVKGVDGEIFNIVDDDLPTSRKFLREYKNRVRRFKSVYVPHSLGYAFCYVWERYSLRSEAQLPPAFTRSRWYIDWRRTEYSNQKLKARLGWKPRISTREGMRRYFDSARGGRHA